MKISQDDVMLLKLYLPRGMVYKGCMKNFYNQTIQVQVIAKM